MRVLVVVLAVLSGALPALADFYVATGGDDSNPGTESAPFATLERARDAIRAAKVLESVTVWIRGGVYPLTKTFALSAEDSGTESAPVIYRAWPGEEARLTGGRRIGGFKPYRDQILQTDLRAQGIADFGKLTSRGFGRAIRPAALELFFQDNPMPLARWPNRGFARTAGAPVGAAGGKFTYEGDRPKRWTNPDDVWVHGYWTQDWADSYESVQSIDVERAEIATKPPHGVYGYAAGKRWRALNLLEELDEPGEWYLNRATGILYFWPTAPLDQGETWVSLLEAPLVSLRNVSYVTLQGLRFEITRGNAVEIDGGSHAGITGCAFRNIGNVAVRVNSGSRHSVESCDISETGDGGIVLSGGDRRTLSPALHFAINNHIHDFSRWVRTYRPAISVSGVGCYVLNNLIHDAPHMAIALSGNDHVLANNDIHSVTLETSDVGAFYMGRDWTWRGNVLWNNFFHNLGDVDANGVYLDDCASGTLVHGNLFHRAARAIHVGGGRDNIIENNIFADCRPAVKVDARGTTWAKKWFDGSDTILFDRLRAVPYTDWPWNERYPQLVNILDDQPALPKGNSVVRNVFYLGRWLELRDGTDKLVALSDNLMGPDPGFADPAANNFELRDDSPAYSLGFERIPIENIGIYADGYRPAVPAVEVVHYSLQVVEPPNKLRLTIENLGRVAVAGVIELWSTAGAVRAEAVPEYALAPGESVSYAVTTDIPPGTKEVVVGAMRRGSDIAPIGTTLRVK